MRFLDSFELVGRLFEQPFNLAKHQWVEHSLVAQVKGLLHLSIVPSLFVNPVSEVHIRFLMAASTKSVVYPGG